MEISLSNSDFIFFITGLDVPERLVPFTESIAWTSLNVEVKNANSTPSNNSNLIFSSNTGMSNLLQISITKDLVTPAKHPEESGGVINFWE